MADHKENEVPPSKNEADDPPAVQEPPVTDEVSVAPSRGHALAAKDSEWIGMRTDFASSENPIPLFPGINITDTTESTTVITKLLVGKTPDFSALQKPQRLFAPKHLSTLREQPKEELNSSDTDVSVLSPAEYRASGSDEEFYDDDDDEPKRATHTRRRKKKSDLKDLPDEKSSVSLIPAVRRKSTSKQRHPDNARPKTVPHSPLFDRASWNFSNDADDEYQTQSDETLGANNPPKRQFRD